MKFRAFPLLVGLLAFLAAAAHADSITETTLTGAAGTTVTFSPTPTNLTSSTVPLNVDSSATSSSGLSVDDNVFLSNGPRSLAGDASSGPFALSNVLTAGTPAVADAVSTFAILGGPAYNADNASDSAECKMVTPEPGTLVLLVSGLLGLGLKSGLRGHGKPAVR